MKIRMGGTAMKNRICLFAGTTEGRLLANRLSKLRQCELCVCVATEYGETLMDSTEAGEIQAGRMEGSTHKV